MIPIGRVLEKLDSYFAKNDMDGAQRHLRYWLEEAKADRDERGRLTVLNEQIGLYRKMERREECLAASDAALKLARSSGLEGTVTLATTLINVATGWKAFGRAEEALLLYAEAEAIYEAEMERDDPRLGGFYNNMGLTLAELGHYREAEEKYLAAMEVMGRTPHGEGEQAVTCLNMADMFTAELGDLEASEKVSELLNRALKLLNTEDLPRDGHYAFICEKCAPVFGYYGFFLAEKELMKRAEVSYERN